MRSFVAGCRGSSTMGWMCSTFGLSSLRNHPPTLSILVTGSHSGERHVSRLWFGIGFCVLRAAISSGKLWAWHSLSSTNSASRWSISWLSAESSVTFWHSSRVASTNSFHVLNWVASGQVWSGSTVVRQQIVRLFSSGNPFDLGWLGFFGQWAELSFRNDGPSFQRPGTVKLESGLPLVISSARFCCVSTYHQVLWSVNSCISETRVLTKTLNLQESDWSHSSTVVESEWTDMLDSESYLISQKLC